MSFGTTLPIYYNKNINPNERLVVYMGLSFVALILLANITKGQGNSMNERYMFPLFGKNSKDCDIVIEFNTLSFSRKDLYVTMTTNYNETYINVIDETPFSMSLKQYLNFSTSKVFTFDVNDTVTTTIRRLHGDVIQVLKAEDLGHEHYLYAENGYFVTFFGTKSNTSVAVERIGSSVVSTYTLNNNEVVTISPNVSDVYRVNGSERIGVIYSNFNISENCSDDKDVLWEMIPPVTKYGQEFLVYIPETENAQIEVLGYQDGHLTLYTMDNVTLIELKAFERKSFSVSKARHVHLMSSIEVAVMGIVNLTVLNKRSATNLFNVLPLEHYAKCSYFDALNCINMTCGYISTKMTNSSVNMFNKDGALVRTFGVSDQLQSGEVISWEINGLSDGTYILQSEQTSTPLTIFKVDWDRGQYYQTVTSENSNCDIFLTESSTNIYDETSFQTFYDKQTSVPNNSLSDFTFSDESTGAYHDNTTFSTLNDSKTVQTTAVNHTVNTMPKLGLLSYLTASNSTIGNDTNASGQINNRLIFPFMYEEIPDDDSVLNEYLIAVIVTLCTAIFAVIGVISTFLLLELLRRRRQLRNTKIRPFVS